jgi:hypothetical protein
LVFADAILTGKEQVEKTSLLSLVQEHEITHDIIKNSVRYLSWSVISAMAYSSFLMAIVLRAENKNDALSKHAYSFLACGSLGIAFPATYYYVKSVGNLFLGCYSLIQK